MEHGLGHVQFQARVKRQVYSDDKLNAPASKMLTNVWETGRHVAKV